MSKNSNDAEYEKIANELVESEVNKNANVDAIFEKKRLPPFTLDQKVQTRELAETAMKGQAKVGGSLENLGTTHEGLINNEQRKIEDYIESIVVDAHLANIQNYRNNPVQAEKSFNALLYPKLQEAVNNPLKRLFYRREQIIADTIKRFEKELNKNLAKKNQGKSTPHNPATITTLANKATQDYREALRMRKENELPKTPSFIRQAVKQVNNLISRPKNR